MFRCGYWSSSTRISWRVNGSSASQFPSIVIGSLIDNGNVVNTLTIPARSEYNGTEVVCVAIFSNGSYKETFPATLTVITAPHQTTVEPKILPIDVSGFEEIPSPSHLILTVGDTYTYRCNHSATDQISWRINQHVLGVEIFPQNFTSSSISFPDGHRVYTLTIVGLSVHNETTIQCWAAFSNGSSPVMSPITTILIQG